MLPTSSGLNTHQGIQGAQSSILCVNQGPWIYKQSSLLVRQTVEHTLNLYHLNHEFMGWLLVIDHCVR